MENLTKEQAIEAMKQGKRVTHRYFDDVEFIAMNSKGMIVFEDGVISVDPEEFWKWRTSHLFDNGWTILPNPESKPKILTISGTAEDFEALKDAVVFSMNWDDDHPEYRNDPEKRLKVWHGKIVERLTLNK
jgi:hypothetical protein